MSWSDIRHSCSIPATWEQNGLDNAGKWRTSCPATRRTPIPGTVKPAACCCTDFAMTSPLNFMQDFIFSLLLHDELRDCQLIKTGWYELKGTYKIRHWAICSSVRQAALSSYLPLAAVIFKRNDRLPRPEHYFFLPSPPSLSSHLPLSSLNRKINIILSDRPADPENNTSTSRQLNGD